MIPGARAYFYELFCYPCFSRIYQQAKRHGVHYGSPARAATLAAGLILVSPGFRFLAKFLISLLDYSLEEINILTLLRLIPSFIFILPVQATANNVNSKMAPHHDPNCRFTHGNFILIAIVSIISIAIGITLTVNGYLGGWLRG
jgi:hypothetical protein